MAGLALPGVGLAQEEGPALEEYRRDLGQVQEEITGLRSRIGALEQAEATASKSLQGLEEKIFYRRQLLRALNGTQRRLEQRPRLRHGCRLPQAVRRGAVP